MQRTGRNATQAFSGALAIATLAALCLAVAPAPTAKANEYRYEARLQAKAKKQGTVRASGIDWSCKQKACTVTGPWPVPGVVACAALAKQVGTVVSYGHPGRKLDAAQLRTCNGGKAATVEIAPVGKKVPMHAAKGVAVPPSTSVPKNAKPISGPSPVSQAISQKITGPRVGGVERQALPEHVRLELPELAITRVEVLEEESTLIPGGRVVVAVQVRNTAAPASGIGLQTDPVLADVETETANIPRNAEREVKARLPIGAPSGSSVRTTVRLARGPNAWSDQNEADNRTTVSYRIGRPELAIVEILGLRDQPVRVGDEVDLRARVRNSGNATVEVDLLTQHHPRNRFTSPSSPPEIAPGRSVEIPFSVEVRPEHLVDGAYRDSAYLVVFGAPGGFVDSNPGDNRRTFTLPIVGHDLEVTGVAYRWGRGVIGQGQDHPMSWEVGLHNTMGSSWELGGLVNVVLYHGTPEAGLRWEDSYGMSVPPISGGNRAQLRHTWSTRLQPGIWYTLRAQLQPHASDGDRTNDCHQIVWFQPTRGSERSERRSRFDCAGERVSLRP